MTEPLREYPKDDTDKSVTISGLWLRRSGNNAVVSVEIDGKWLDVITEHVDGQFSHIVEPCGIKEAKPTALDG